MHWAIFLSLLALAFPNLARAGQIHICAQDPDSDDWQGMFHWGSVHIPPGTIFDEINPPSGSVPGPAYSGAIITTSGATLSKAKPCANVTGEAVISSGWHWNVSPIFADSSTSYGILGFMQDGDLQFPPDSPPTDGLQAAIDVYSAFFIATVTGTLDRAFTLDHDDQ